MKRGEEEGNKGPPIPPFSPFHSAEKKHFRRRRDPIFERQRGFHPSFVACCSLQVLVYVLYEQKEALGKNCPWCHFTIRMVLLRVREGKTPNMNQAKVCYEKYSRRCASEWSELLFPPFPVHILPPFPHPFGLALRGTMQLSRAQVQQ